MNGAKWWKFDFHVHTPASFDYREPQLSPRDFLISVMQKGLDCIAVTDHDSCNWIDCLRTELTKIKTEAPHVYRELTIFPGVEIEVFPAIHLLAIFDPQKPLMDISSVISRIQNAGNRTNFQDAVNLIQRSGGIAIPAHVDDAKGLFTTIREGSALKNVLDNCDFFATEVTDPTYSFPQLCVDMKREFTNVMGSDAHERADIGRRFSWVKMEMPTIESLALALQDSEDGIITSGSSSSSPNSLGNRCFIEKLIVERGQKIGNGKEFCVHFSPWLNTIIGGRGSGKTTITEFLRIVFGKGENLPKEIAAAFNKFSKVPSNRTDVGMLRKNTTIHAYVKKDGRELKLIWESGKWTEYCNDSGEWKLSDGAGNVDQRFPIHIYSQKQLYEMAEDPNCLIHYINGLFDYSAWKQHLSTLREEYKSLCRQARELSQKISQEEALKARLSDLDAKITTIEAAANNPIFSKAKLFTSQYENFKSEITNIISCLSEMHRDITQTTLVEQTSVESILDEESSKNYQEFILKWSILMSDYINLQERMTELKNIGEDICQNHHISATFEAAKSEYANTISALKQQGIDNIDELETLYSQRTVLNQQIEDILYLKSQLDEIEAKKSAQLEAIIAHQQLLRQERMEIISRLNSDSVRITLLPMQDLNLAEREFRSIIRKENQFQSVILDSDNIKDSFIGQLCSAPDGVDIWQNRLETLTSLINHKSCSKKYGKRFSDYISTLCDEYPEDIDDLLMWVPPDAIQLEIKMDGRFSNIAQGSAGQKTTALLSLILRSNTGPLIIDQPEDDLDTKLISEMLVTELRNQKLQNQVIVVTHNPNIPVNGAAEQIIAMNFVSGQIACKVEGALQNQAIRNEICDVMEGGRDALKKRYYRIYKPLYQ